MRAIGFDFGSVYTKAVLLDGEGNLALSCYAKKSHDDRRLMGEFFAETAARCPGVRFRVGAAGVEPGQVPPGVHTTNAILATAEGVHRLHPGTKTVIEIGGHTSKFIVLRRGRAAARLRHQRCLRRRDRLVPRAAGAAAGAAASRSSRA